MSIVGLTANAMIVDEWYHITIPRKSGKRPRLFIDGEETFPREKGYSHAHWRIVERARRAAMRARDDRNRNRSRR